MNTMMLADWQGLGRCLVIFLAFAGLTGINFLLIHQARKAPERPLFESNDPTAVLGVLVQVGWMAVCAILFYGLMAK